QDGPAAPPAAGIGPAPAHPVRCAGQTHTRVRPMHHPTRLIAALTAILLALAPSFASTDHDLWYIIEMAGQRSGTLHSVQRTEGDRITSISETRLKIRRDRAAIEVAVTTEFVETLDGKPISMSATQVMGAEPTTMTYTFGPGGV